MSEGVRDDEMRLYVVRRLALALRHLALLLVRLSFFLMGTFHGCDTILLSDCLQALNRVTVLHTISNEKIKKESNGYSHKNSASFHPSISNKFCERAFEILVYQEFHLKPLGTCCRLL